MHVLAVDDSDPPTTFAYRDSGAPGSETYTTLVVVHGLIFHSGVFQRILPLAASKNLRLICLNRRDYQGSTPYNPSELRVLSEGNDIERAASLKARGVELALFLDRLIVKLELPQPNTKGDEGGLAMMGWSLGNVFAVAALAAVSSLPSCTRARLQRFLRRFIVFEPPANAFGIPIQGNPYFPLSEESIPQEERAPTFSRWVSSYFSHGDLSSRDYCVIEHRNPDPSRKAAIADMPVEELDSLVDYIALSRSDRFFSRSCSAAVVEQTSKVLLDPKFIVNMWPQMKTWYLRCDSTAWIMIHAVWGMEDLLKANNNDAVKFLMIENAHHLIPWDDPERALHVFHHCLKN